MIYDKVPKLQVNKKQQSTAYLRRQKWTNPALGTATKVHANITCPTSGTTTTTTGFTAPDFPRNITVKGNQVTVTGNVVINGTDIRGTVITETIASSGTDEVAGKLAFATVTSVVIPTRGATSDAISIGFGARLGLDRKCDGDDLLISTYNGTAEDASIVVTGTSLAGCVYVPTAAMDGAKDLACTYIANEITNSNATTA